MFPYVCRSSTVYNIFAGHSFKDTKAEEPPRNVKKKHAEQMYAAILANFIPGSKYPIQTSGFYCMQFFFTPHRVYACRTN